jgi:DedD protein
MPSNPNQTLTPSQEQTKSPPGRRLIIAVVLIGLAIGGLAAVDRYRERRTGAAPPHEPSQALITTPAPEPDAAPARPGQPIGAPPPPPPKIVNNETLAPPPRPSGATAAPSEAAAKGSSMAERSTSAPGKAYLVQVGIFNSPANAQVLQKQLRRAGIEAHLETRVQLGPFKDKRDADRALARARKLGIDAVLVSIH